MFTYGPEKVAYNIMSDGGLGSYGTIRPHINLGLDIVQLGV